MTHDLAWDAQKVAHAYHCGWTNKRFGESIALLSPALEVEVPINSYPTRQSFAEALAGFGEKVERVELLAELASGNEAMLLYDLTAPGLGTLRIAEHFTVADGKITRLRQVHDTAPIRAAGLTEGR